MENAVIITFDDGYESVYQNAYPVLKQAEYRAAVFVVSGFIGDWNLWDTNLGRIRYRHLSAEQIKELSREGWEVGSHGMRHRPLSYINNRDLHWELYRSREMLETIVEEPISSFAYPFGIHNVRVQRAVRDAGYKIACASIHWNGMNGNPYTIFRLPVYKCDHSRSLGRKLHLPTSPGEKARLLLLNFPARFAAIYQILFRHYLFLEK